MPDIFDPYHKWLGISRDERPPNHYRLLGIDLFENDPDVISNAADRQMLLLRTFSAGKHGEVAEQLLNEIAATKVCLLNASRKAHYDHELQAQLESSNAVDAAEPDAAEYDADLDRLSAGALAAEVDQGLAELFAQVEQPPTKFSSSKSLAVGGLQSIRSEAATAPAPKALTHGKRKKRPPYAFLTVGSVVLGVLLTALIVEMLRQKPPPPPPPPPPWPSHVPRDVQQFAGHYYKRIDEPLPWHEARANCEALGGYLCCVKDSKELAFCLTLAAAKDVWLGGTDYDNEDQWHWVDGSDWNFVAWSGGEPSNWAGSEHALTLGGNGTWNDLNNDCRLAYICEWERKPRALPRDAVTAVKIDRQAATPFAGHEYLVVRDKLTWQQAKRACEAAGGYLCNVESQAEWEHILTLKPELCWLGATDSAKERTWKWTSGQSLGFTAWAPAEPGDWNGGEHGLGVVNGRWQDWMTGSRTGFVCEWDRATARAGQVYLFDLEPIEQNQWANRSLKQTVAVGGEPSPHGLMLHPTSNRFARAIFQLAGRYSRLAGKVGINDTSAGPVTPLTFRIEGDGQTLWKSRPMQRKAESQAFDVSIRGVTRLGLFVECPGSDMHAHAVWIEPRLFATQ